MKSRTACLILICSMLLIVAGPSILGASETKGPSGKVVFALAGDNFGGAKGGDIGTVKVAFQPFMTALGEPLYIKDVDAKVVPALAESWEIAQDSLSIKFKMRKGPIFHNGDPITAHDVKFSVERYMDKKYRMNYGSELRQKIKSIEVHDDYHLTFYFTGPYNAFFDRFYEYFMILPKNVIEKVGDKAYTKNPVCSGPFKWVGCRQDVWMDLEAFEGHYRKVPEIKTLRFSYVPEHSTRLAMLRTGEADMISPGPAHIREIEKDPRFRIVWTDNTTTEDLAIGDLIREGDLPLKDRRVRMAVSYAIDRKAICDVIKQGTARPVNGYLAPWHPGYDPPKAKPVPYDPEKAKALLANAGYPEGFETTITSFSTAKRWVQAIAGYLAKVGIKANIRILEGGTYTDICHAKKVEGIITRGAWWNARAHPTSPIDGQLTLKAPWSCGITTKRISDIMEEVGTLSLQHPDLARKSREMDDIIMEDLPRIQLWATRTAIALGPRIEHYEPINGFLIPTRTEFIRLKK